ncbi:hypothetical protein ACKWTF_010886 [Chironomus riparius]
MEDVKEFKLYGNPVNILNVTDRNEFIVDIEGINKILLRPDLIERKIVAVSIVGIFRKGKSFLLNYFLRYLYGNFKSVNHPDNPLNNTEDWMGNKNEPLLGFQWKASIEKVTNGIIMWSDVFIYDTKEGEKFAIVLIDTQGLFDQKTSPSVNSKMFAISTLISSVQIYNLHNVVQEDQLQYLQFTSDFAKLINNIDNEEDQDDLSVEKPFQKIILLMRDWVNKAKYPYGSTGGEKYLNEVLKIQDDHEADARNVRKFIRSSYEEIKCFLMPHPGNKIFETNNFNGEWSKLDEDFVKQMKDLSSWIFNPLNLRKKKTYAEYVTAEDYAEHLKYYIEAVSSNELMNVSSIFESVMESEVNILLQKSIKISRNVLRSNENFENESLLTQLDKIGEQSQKSAINNFLNAIQDFSTNENFITKWSGRLKNQLSKELNDWKVEVTLNYKKFYNAKKLSQEKAGIQLESLKKDFDSKLMILIQKNTMERTRMEEQMKSTMKQADLEKIKIQQEREAERGKLIREKLKDLENAKKECEKIVKSAKNSYQSEIDEIKEREEKLQAQKNKLEKERKDQEKILKDKLERENREHQLEVSRLKVVTSLTEKRLREEMEKAQAMLEAEIKRMILMSKLELEEFKLKQKLKDLQHKSELDRIRNGRRR